MPGSLFSDAPSTPDSGPALSGKCNVQHRSEILFKEQIENVKNTQTALKATLQDLEGCKDETKVEEMCKTASILKQITDEEVIKLQVIKKINNELKVARYDLDCAVQGRGNLKSCRERVMWLEGRIEFIMGRQRIKNLGENQQLNVEPFKDPNIESADTNESIYTSSHQDASSQASTEQDWYQDKLAAAEERMMQDSQCTDISKPSPDLKHGGGDIGIQTHNHDIKLIKHITGEGNENSNATCMDIIMNHVNEINDTSTLATSDVKSKTVGLSSDVATISYESTEFARSDSLNVDHTNEKSPDHHDDCESPGRLVSKSAPAIISAPTEDEEQDTRGTHLATDLPQRPATYAKDPGVVAKRSVSVRSPKSKEITHLGQLKELSVVEYPTHPTPDMSLQYWTSEHHRMQYGPSSRVICEQDPLSYHQMGIAVPGSFLPKVRDQPKGLPWRSTDQAYEIHDIHKVALDKLSGRIRDISQKMFDAADVSANKTTRMKDNMLASSSNMGQIEESIIQKISRSQQSRDTDLIPDIKLPKLEGRRLGTSGSGRVVFYPNPIPQPEALPITRVNRNKVYPRIPGTFCDMDSADRSKVIRVVDQHNLYEETKLTLYQERSVPPADGIQSTEMRLRYLLDDEAGKSAISSVSTRLSSVTTPGSYPIKRYISQKTRAHFTAMKAIARLKVSGSRQSASSWGNLKPRSNTLDHSGLRWERVKTLAHVNLVSERVEERRDAARHLGLLRCGDAMIFYALKERLSTDEDGQVKFEAAKSLILVGCWEEEVIYRAVQFLILGNEAIRMDLISTMIEGRNIQYVNKTTPGFRDLVRVLSHFTCHPNPDSMIAFSAAVLLGKLCVVNENAKNRLLAALQSTKDTHISAKALEILVKYMNTTDWSMVTHILDQLHHSPVWKYRALAAKLLILLGVQHVCVDDKEPFVYDQLERQLWDDPVTAVRLSVAKAITALNMLPRATERVEKKLEDPDEECRAQAVVSLGTLGMRNEKVIRSLLEMLELDSSEYVRIMIVRTFGTLELTDRRVLRVLREKTKMDGSLAKEAKKTLRSLTSSSPAPIPPCY